MIESKTNLISDIKIMLQTTIKARKYNLVILFKSGLEGESLNSAINEVTSYIKEEQIQIHDIEIQRKELKYKIKNELAAQFVIIKFIAYPSQIRALEQKIKHKKTLIRYLITRTSEHIKNMFEPQAIEYDKIHPINDLSSLIDNCGRIKISKKVHPKYKRKMAKVIKTSRSIALLPLK